MSTALAPTNTDNQPDPNQSQLKELVERFRFAYNNFYPHNASFLLGLHAYDGRVPDFSPGAVAAWQKQLADFSQQLATQINYPKLSKSGKFDYKLVESYIELELLRHGSLRYYERNPIMPYIYIFDVSNYIKRNYAPLQQRIVALCQHLEATPRLISQLMQKLDKTLPRAAVEISLETFRGFARYYRDGDLVNQAVEAFVSTDEGKPPAPLQARLVQAAEMAGAALDEYVRFFQQHLTTADANFAIGPENYTALLKWGEMVELGLDQLLQIGLADMRRNQVRLRQTCATLLNIAADHVDVPAVIKAIGQEHPSNAELVPTTLHHLHNIQEFLVESGVIDVPDELNCIVAHTPPFMRWIFADMETPGPFETVATEAHFYITPANTEWPLARQEEWLSRFNDYVIQIFSIHEAYPGHYLQHLHARNSPSPAAQNLTSYSFIEGWAHYCEQMLLEEGYAQNRAADIKAKLQIAQLEEALVRDCRFICSIGLHTQGWTVEQALHFYQANAYMEEATAQREASRSTFDPAGLNYTLGKLLFYKLRADYQSEKAAKQERFILRDFHNQCLAYGMPPIVLLRSMLLQNESDEHNTIL